MNDLLKAAYKGIKRDYFGRMASDDGEAGGDIGYQKARRSIWNSRSDYTETSSPNEAGVTGPSVSPPLFLRDPKEIAE